MITHVRLYPCRTLALCHASPLLRPSCWDHLQSSLQVPEARASLTAVSDARISCCRGSFPFIAYLRKAGCKDMRGHDGEVGFGASPENDCRDEESGSV